jgi:hypothetical protein
VEEKPALCERYLAKAYDRFSKVAQTLPVGHKDRLNTLLLCGELERRLGKFEAAGKRFREVLALEEFKEEPRREPIVTLQLRLIEAKDRAPHALGPLKEVPRIPLGVAPPAPSLTEDPKPAETKRSGPLDINKPFSLESGSPDAFTPRK